MENVKVEARAKAMEQGKGAKKEHQMVVGSDAVMAQGLAEVWEVLSDSVKGTALAAGSE